MYIYGLMSINPLYSDGFSHTCYNNVELSIADSFSYLGFLTPGGSFSLAQNTLSGQSKKLFSD